VEAISIFPWAFQQISSISSLPLGCDLNKKNGFLATKPSPRPHIDIFPSLSPYANTFITHFLFSYKLGLNFTQLIDENGPMNVLQILKSLCRSKAHTKGTILSSKLGTRTYLDFFFIYINI
jgi:hypothetical protein